MTGEQESNATSTATGGQPSSATPAVRLDSLDGGRDGPSVGAFAGALPLPGGWTDVLTGTDGPRLWDRLLTSEQARNARHGRTSTIALVEFYGLDATARRWGADVAVQLFTRVARVLASGIRSSDHIARVDRTRFAVLLVETDEVLAINFVDRVRARCADELGSDWAAVRVAIGWASPEAGGSLAEASNVAFGRLQDHLARQV
jgi:diguanylate cyclase (GGDEF)-like protein